MLKNVPKIFFVKNLEKLFDLNEIGNKLLEKVFEFW
jgi:hypothetical protein